MQVFIANKIYSSWSMRPWVLVREAGVAFNETLVPFDDCGPGSAFKQKVASVSPARRVPVLVDGGLAIWDTLAIAEYLAETFPEKHLWPADRAARARARYSLSTAAPCCSATSPSPTPTTRRW